MRPDRTDDALVWDMLAAARSVVEFTSGRTFEDYEADKLLRSAVERQMSSRVRQTKNDSRSMKPTQLVRGICLVLFATAMAHSVAAEGKAASPATRQKELTMKDAQTLFRTMEGQWKGTCRTWFEPGKLADESRMEGSIRRILNGDFLRHEYSATLQGKPRTGEETLMFNPVKKKFEASWIDSFHMNYGIMFSVGDATEDGFFVRGSYDVAPNSPPWGWKTVYQVIDDDHLKITAFNILPDGMEANAVEIDYTRSKE